MMREATDISQFLKDNETPETRAYEHALDLAFLFVTAMEEQGLSKAEMAKKMKVSPQRLSKLLNTQPNMTLETIAQFELALGVDVRFSLNKHLENAEIVETVVHDFNFAFSDIRASQGLQSESTSEIFASVSESEFAYPSIWRGGLAA